MPYIPRDRVWDTRNKIWFHAWDMSTGQIERQVRLDVWRVLGESLHRTGEQLRQHMNSERA